MNGSTSSSVVSDRIRAPARSADPLRSQAATAWPVRVGRLSPRSSATRQRRLSIQGSPVPVEFPGERPDIVTATLQLARRDDHDVDPAGPAGHSADRPVGSLCRIESAGALRHHDGDVDIRGQGVARLRPSRSRSASSDRVAAVGSSASSWDPRIAAEPTTRRSGSSMIRDAARSTCSSSSRFMGVDDRGRDCPADRSVRMLLAWHSARQRSAVRGAASSGATPAPAGGVGHRAHNLLGSLIDQVLPSTEPPFTWFRSTTARCPLSMDTSGSPSAMPASSSEMPCWAWLTLSLLEFQRACGHSSHDGHEPVSDAYARAGKRAARARDRVGPDQAITPGMITGRRARCHAARRCRP